MKHTDRNVEPLDEPVQRIFLRVHSVNLAEELLEFVRYRAGAKVKEKLSGNDPDSDSSRLIKATGRTLFSGRSVELRFETEGHQDGRETISGPSFFRIDFGPEGSRKWAAGFLAALEPLLSQEEESPRSQVHIVPAEGTPSWEEVVDLLNEEVEGREKSLYPTGPYDARFHARRVQKAHDLPHAIMDLRLKVQEIAKEEWREKEKVSS